MVTIHNKFLKIPEPKDINVSRDFIGTFETSESETSANFIVRYCQSVGNWSPFSYKDLNNYYLAIRGRKAGDRNFDFFNLAIKGWIAKDGDLFCVTLGFLGRLQPYTKE